MKTNFFKRFVFTEKQKEAMSYILKIDKPLFDLISNTIKTKNSLRRLNNLEIRKLVNESGQSADDIIDTLNNFKSLIGFYSLRSKENFQDLIDDIQEIFPDLIKDISEYNERMKVFHELSEQFTPYYKGQISKLIVTPSLENLEGCVIMKPVFDERFDFDEIDIKKYEPKLLKKIACILLKLTNSDNSSITIQFDAIEYERFLNELIALQIELKSFENECD